LGKIKFDTKVQFLKYKVLREVANCAWDGTLSKKILDIPEIIVPGNKATMRCCVYKERAILAKRVKSAIGGDRSNNNIIETIDIACDECPVAGYEVTTSCRGCLAHRCKRVCKFGAISFDSQQRAVIDKSKCKECGACAKVCPYTAIINVKRPCQNACKIKAISMDENNAVQIDHNKCISCGACVYQCPFGAITDKSFIVDVIDLIKGSENNTKYEVYAVIAPSVYSQFTNAKIGQVVSGIKKLGFKSVIEAALGADMVASAESKELAEKKFLMSSCCPAFVEYIRKNFPDLEAFISHNLSPMAVVSKYIKTKYKNSKVVFIGPCTAKKVEIQQKNVKEYVDSVITFEELIALFDSRNIDIEQLEECPLEDASYFGRIFARCGGLADAVAQGLKENGFEDFKLNAVSCDGIEECRTALLKKSKGVLDSNFIEGMACIGGCIGGAGCITHGLNDKNIIEKFGRLAENKTISDAISTTES